ncbi:MAG: hypothetical protein DI626_02250 [Micavibrio aeruginosavorus]|uniref:Uncharacterized protein n=1 Tax=Micavibrio aeruginosavorus TaxID=349221 RepID=A0A2W5C2H3_9BACT|nr:MAG: hypothetical protein DI626_02250 [Micavibrio aeruginosavorus]
MQESIPQVVVVPLIDGVMNAVKRLYKDDFVDPDLLKDFIEKTKPIHFMPLHDAKKPFEKVDTDGNKVRYYMWGHKDNLLKPEFLISMICPLSKDEAGMDVYKPASLIRGSYINSLIIGGMTCCGGALQTHWSQAFSDGSPAIDDARVPVSGVEKDHQYWLRNKVHIADTPQGLAALNHMALDVLAQRFPEKFSHECGTKLNYGKYIQKMPTPGMK